MSRTAWFRTALALAIIVIFQPLAQAQSGAATPAAAEKPSRNVLFLFAFEHNVPSYQKVERGVRRVLEADASAKTVFFSEHMDLARFPEEAYRESLVDRYRQKYARKKIDLIVALNSPALDFLTQHAEQVFSDVPLIFSLMVKGEIERRRLPPRVTGVADTPDFVGTLELALRLLPGTRKVVVVSGSDEADKGFERQIRLAYEPYQSRLEFAYLSGLPMNELLREVAGLPQGSVIIYSSIYRDGRGQAFVPIEALRLFSPVASAPVFGAWDPFLGNGAVGGSVADLEQDGLDVGKLALDILRGGPGQPLPAMRLGKNTVMVDWRQMRRWGLSTDNLPRGSVVMFQEKGFWDLYLWEALGGIALLLLESLLIGLLLAQRAKRVRAEESLRLANEGLELRVRERTAELEGANQRLQMEMRERRQAEEALRQSEEKFRLAFMTSPDAILITRLQDGLYVEANDGLLKLSGYAPAEVIGRTSLEINVWNDPADREALTHYIREQGYCENLEARMRKQDGSLTTALISARLISLDGVPHIISVTRDISERIAAQEEKDRLEGQLRQAMKMEAIGTLAGGVAHDFNNILGAVVGYAEMALDDLKETGKVDPEDIRQVIHAADRAKGLVKQILAFSRKVEYNLRPIALNKPIEEMLPMLERTLPKMVGIETNLAPDLSPIAADPNQIEQIILNLASNASDAMPEGGKLYIETSNVVLDDEFRRQRQEVVPGSYVQLAVSDTGQGMADNVLERIYDPFYTTKDVGKGTGLGLSTVYGIVKSHEGHILCHSEPGMGTTFRIYFPAVQGACQKDETTALNGDLPGGAETILLVDDEEALRRLGAKTLGGMGYRVMTAESGESALETYRRQAAGIDLVVMDLGMPGMGGYKAMRGILALNPRAKVVIASGYSTGGRAKGALEDGAVGYVAKPFKRAELLTTVREALDK